jgi:hypothetical protein
MNIDQLVFKLLEVTLVLVRKSLKFLLLRNQVPIVGQSMNNRNCLNFFPEDIESSEEFKRADSLSSTTVAEQHEQRMMILS